MSLIITCQHCGPRSVEEFSFGEIPVVPKELEHPNERDLDRAYFFHNTEGQQSEAWFHLYGCRRWTTVSRDTTEDLLVAPPPEENR